MNTPKTLVVTGASRGLGAHIAAQAVAQGYRVIGIARNADDAGSFPIRKCDVTDGDAVKEVFKEIRKDKSFFGLINAAGVASMNLLVSTPPETIKKIVDINLTGTINCCAAASKALMRQKGGRIINFSTIAVPLGLKGEAVYVASKAGVEGFTRSFAREMGDFGVTVNAVAPGPIPTDLIRKVPSESIDELVTRQIIPEQGTLDDVWDIVSLLLDERAKMVTGETLHIGGA